MRFYFYSRLINPREGGKSARSRLKLEFQPLSPCQQVLVSKIAPLASQRRRLSRTHRATLTTSQKQYRNRLFPIRPRFSSTDRGSRLRKSYQALAALDSVFLPPPTERRKVDSSNDQSKAIDQALVDRRELASANKPGHRRQPCFGPLIHT